MAHKTAGDHFDPIRRFASLLLQKGRTLLDEDWEELASVVEKRARVAVRDTGTAAMAVVDRAGEEARELAEEAYAEAGRAARVAVHQAREHPLVTAVTVLALGILVAGLLRSRR